MQKKMSHIGEVFDQSIDQRKSSNVVPNDDKVVVAWIDDSQQTWEE